MNVDIIFQQFPLFDEKKNPQFWVSIYEDMRNIAEAKRRLQTGEVCVVLFNSFLT